MELTLSRLLAAAKQKGYTGPEDAASVVAYFTSKNITIKSGGEVVDLKTATVIDDVSAKTAEEAVLPDADVAELARDEHRRKSRNQPVGNPEARPVLSVSGGDSLARKDYEAKIKSGKAAFLSYDKAEAFGHFIIGELVGRSNGASQLGERVQKSRTWLERNGLKAYSTSPGSGGNLVGETFLPDVIRLANEYGVFARNAKRVTMSDSAATVYQVKDGVTGTYPTENSTGTASANDAWTARTVYAKEFVVNVQMSKAILQDAVVNLADETANSIARVIAYQEDLNGFLGDGSSTYGGMVGLVGAYNGVGGTGLTAATAYSAVNTDGTTGASSWANYNINHFHRAMALAHPAIWRGQPKWYVHSNFYWDVMRRVAFATSGTSAEMVLSDGTARFMFLGQPVEFTQVMNSTAANSTNPTYDAFFGDLGMAAILGRRQDVSIETDYSVVFDQRAVMLQGSIRHGVNVAGAVGGLATSATGAAAVSCLYQT